MADVIKEMATVGFEPVYSYNILGELTDEIKYWVNRDERGIKTKITPVPNHTWNDHTWDAEIRDAKDNLVDTFTDDVDEEIEFIWEFAHFLMYDVELPDGIATIQSITEEHFGGVAEAMKQFSDELFETHTLNELIGD